MKNTNEGSVVVRKNPTSDRVEVLANLLKQDCLSYRMLLHNLVELVQYDEALVVDVVLALTNKERVIDARITDVEFQSALVAVRCASNLRCKFVLSSALSDVMKQSW